MTVGHAHAARLRGSDSVAVAVIGDGAVNTGAFHEAMNVAGVMRLPVIVVVENNEWAISVPFSAASATETVAERAPAWAAVGERVDGNDVEAVASAFGAAVERGRHGGGPTIIEATCYRFRGHFEGDADVYRTEAEKEQRRAIDPLALTRDRLIATQAASADELAAMENAISQAVEQMLASVRADALPAADTATHHIFVEEMP